MNQTNDNKVLFTYSRYSYALINAWIQTIGKKLEVIKSNNYKKYVVSYCLWISSETLLMFFLSIVLTYAWISLIYPFLLVFSRKWDDVCMRIGELSHPVLFHTFVWGGILLIIAVSVIPAIISVINIPKTGEKIKRKYLQPFFFYEDRLKEMKELIQKHHQFFMMADELKELAGQPLTLLSIKNDTFLKDEVTFIKLEFQSMKEATGTPSRYAFTFRLPTQLTSSFFREENCINLSVMDEQIEGIRGFMLFINDKFPD